MHNVILLHGHGGSPESFWLPYLRRNLGAKGYDVWSPQLPNTSNPDLNKQLAYLQQHGMFTSETIIISHSAASALTLALLETLEVKIRQVILVAAFVELPEQLKPFNLQSIIKETYNWDAIRNNTQELIVINSDNDPFGCNVYQAEIILKNMGGIMVVPYGEGHMGSETLQQPYREFPLLLRLVV